jgi:hypothetical protein
MGVAEQMGLGDEGSPLLDAARAAWRTWCADEVLGVVRDLYDFRGWTEKASAEEKHAVLGRLAAMTAFDSDAVTALAWLLIPGASNIAAQLGDLHSDVDGLVAGQLWIEVAGAHQIGRAVASTILRRVRSAVCLEAGVGESANRRDRAWSLASRDAELREFAQPASMDEPGPELVELFHAAQEHGAIGGLDYWLLWALAAEADWQNAPARRGRLGLTAPAVVEAVADDVGLAPRSLRARAARALDRLKAYAEAREDPVRFAQWQAQHRACELTARDEIELVLIEDEWDRFERERPGVPLKQLRVAFNVVLGTRRRRTA